MGKETRSRAVEREIHAAISAIRGRYDHISYCGAGTRLIQVLFYPTWDPIESWDICQVENDQLALFRSTGTLTQPMSLLGYERVEAGAAFLQEFVNHVAGAPVCLLCPPEPMAIADGTSYEIAVFGGIQACCRLYWRGGEAPAEWQPLAGKVEAAVARFRSLRGTGGV